MFIETIEEFTQRHGPYVETENGSRVFRDGARVEFGSDPQASRYAGRSEPPYDPIELLRAERRYWQLKLDAQVGAYTQYHARVQQQLHDSIQYPAMCPPPGDLAEQQLAQGQQRIAALRAELQRVDAELGQTPEAVQRAAVKEREQQEQHERTERLNRLNQYAI